VRFGIGKVVVSGGERIGGRGAATDDGDELGFGKRRLYERLSTNTFKTIS
jgi:hypothetical protein